MHRVRKNMYMCKLCGCTVRTARHTTGKGHESVLQIICANNEVIEHSQTIRPAGFTRFRLIWLLIMIVVVLVVLVDGEDIGQKKDQHDSSHGGLQLPGQAVDSR